MPRQIVLYTQSACAPCDQVRALLSEKGLDYEARDISADPQALKELTALGFMATPVTLIDGETVVGFDRKRIEALLARQE